LPYLLEAPWKKAFMRMLIHNAMEEQMRQAAIDAEDEEEEDDDDDDD